MNYIVIDKTTNSGYILTDIPGIANVINTSKHTVTTWFRDNKQYHETDTHYICKNPERIKSNRSFPSETRKKRYKPFGN